MMEERTTPMNWVINRLGDFVYYQKGKKPKSVSNIKTISHSIPYVNIKAFEKGIIDEFTDGDGCVLCEQGDFLMVWDGARSGYIGRSLKGALGSTLVKIQFPGVNLDYAYFYLQSKYLEINTRAKGTGIPHVDPELVWNYNFPLPPLAEQQRIVAKIEELFSELDKGIETLKTAQKQLKVYRQAVLKYAFEGKLTNPDVKEGELPEGWVETTIKDVCMNIKVGIVIKPTNYYSNNGTGIKAFRSANVREFRINDTNWVHFSVEANEQNFRTKVFTGDVLLVRSGYPGTSCVVTEKFSGCNAIDILIATPKIDFLLPEYLCAFNNSPLGKGMFAENAHGVAQKHLNVGEYSRLKIFIPEISKQREVLNEIESRLSVCDKIEESIEQGLQQAEALRQSILKKAFEGKLVPQDPNDEPASVLLKRIKAERAAAQPEKKSRTKKVKA